MTRSEWESLCDHCGQCCLHKLEDVDSGSVLYTSIVCQYMDLDSCHCTCYTDRTSRVPDCVQLTPDLIGQLAWLPDTCAYRLVAEGKDLLPWHPLVSGESDTVHLAGISIRGVAIPENCVHPDELMEYMVPADEPET